MSRLACVAAVLLISSSAHADDPAVLKAVVAKALKAANADKLRAVTAWTLTETLNGKDMKTVTTTHAQLPDRLRVQTVTTTPAGTTTSLTVIKGDRGWVSDDDGRFPSQAGHAPGDRGIDPTEPPPC